MTHRKKIIYATVIGLALLGVLIDRLMNGATSGVSSAVAASAVSSTIRATDAPGMDAPTVSIRPAGFPTPVAQAGMLDAKERDPFEISAAALAYLKPPSAEGPKSGNQDDARITGDSFEESHRLEAILHAAGETVAVVDGILVRAGQSLDGCQLEQIQTRAAIFACADGKTELSLDELLPASP